MSARTRCMRSKSDPARQTCSEGTCNATAVFQDHVSHTVRPAVLRHTISQDSFVSAADPECSLDCPENTENQWEVCRRHASFLAGTAAEQADAEVLGGWGFYWSSPQALQDAEVCAAVASPWGSLAAWWKGVES